MKPAMAGQRLLADGSTPDEVISQMTSHARALGIGTGEVHELRVITSERSIYTGYYDTAEQLALDALTYDGWAHIYVTVNAVAANLLARAPNRLVPSGKGIAAHDEDVPEQRRLFVDIDPVRPEGFKDSCATDEEHEHALASRDYVRITLFQHAGAVPLIFATGNGGALVYELTGPADEVRVKRVLKLLAKRFDTEHARIDPAVSNRSRIMRLAGTLNLKRTAPGRPQRRCRLENGGGR